MQTNQNLMESLKDRMQRGILTTAQANVEMVRAERFRLVTGKIPREVRKALNDGCKEGKLKRLAKDGHKPEVYCHPTFEYMAIAARNEADRRAKQAIMKIAGFPV